MTAIAAPTTAGIEVLRPGGAHQRRGPSLIRGEDLPGVVRAGETVVIGHGSGWPRHAVQALVTGATHPFSITHNRIEDELPYFDASVGSRVRHIGLMVSGSTRAHIATGAANYVPNTYSHTAALFRTGALSCDVVLLHVSPPDSAGFCSLGTCSAYLPAAIERARLVIAQVNPQMPRTFGTRVHARALDHIIEVDEPLYSESAPEADDVVTSIARNVAGLVRDGDVLQVGIGKLGDAVLAEISGRSNLRMWSETFGDAALRLLRARVFVPGPNGEAPITATFVTGSPRLYEALHHQSGVALLPVDHTNHPSRLAAVPGLLAVNSAIEVDLTGQVNAESIAGRIYSGPGGHLDFAIGATASPGGRYVCALPSTARAGRSRIVVELSQGAAVTVPRSLTHFVVTEHGVADLAGCDLSERAEALVAVAHPDHRPDLEHAIGARSARRH